MTSLLERALEAEERADALQQRADDLASRLRAAINAEPTTATRALSWVQRAEQAEGLVGDIVRLLDQRSLSGTDLPPGWEARARSQLKAVELLRRDQAEMAERPKGEADAYWTTYADSKGRRGVVKDDSGWMHRA